MEYLTIEQVNRANEVREIGIRFRKSKDLKIIKGEKIKKPKKIIKRKYQNRIPRTYAVYIKSQWWTKRKNKYFQKHKRECAKCGSNKYITLHHAVYGKYFYEKDVDLFPLCTPCHRDFHERYGISGNMRKETEEFIRERYL